MRRLKNRWSRTSLATRVTLWYTLLLAVVLCVLVIVLFGALVRWVEEQSLAQLGQEAQDVRVALVAAAQNDEPFSTSAARVLSNVLGRNVQGSVWAADGRLIARSDGFYFPQEKPPASTSSSLDDGSLPEAYVHWSLPAKPSLASSDTIGTLSNQLFIDSDVASAGQDRVAMIIAALDGVPDDLVATSTAHPDVPPLQLPAVPGVGPRRAVIALTMSFASEAASISGVVALMAVAAGLVLLVGALIARRIVRRSLMPIDGLANASQSLAAGKLTTRVSVPPGDDEIVHLAHAFNDMAVQMDSAFTAQRAFVADASHELRTPLAALRGQVDVLRRALPEQPADADRLAASMRRELARLSRLVDDLLVLARLDAIGPAALSSRSIDVCSVAEDVCAQIGALPSARGRDIRFQPAARVRVVADDVRLHQVLLNLLANAVEHTPAGGCVTLCVAASAEGAHIEVHDTGPGIPEEQLPNIFDRFYRADGTRRHTDGGGAGLGLAIARAIVEAHGGEIRAANQRGGGAAFLVDLPSQACQPRG
jgi:signal transduction histidine kinase